MAAWNGHVVRPYSHTPRDIKCVMPPLRGRKGLVEILFPAVIVPNLCFVQLSAWDCGVLLCDSWIGVDEYLLQCILILAGSMNNTLEAKRLFSIVLKYSRSTKNASDTKTYVGRSLFAAQGWNCGQFKNSPGDRSKQMVCLKVNSSHALQAADEIISKSSVEPACLPESIAGSPTWKISVLGQIFLQCRDLKALEKMRLKKCRIWKKKCMRMERGSKIAKDIAVWSPLTSTIRSPSCTFICFSWHWVNEGDRTCSPFVGRPRHLVEGSNLPFVFDLRHLSNFTKVWEMVTLQPMFNGV